MPCYFDTVPQHRDTVSRVFSKLTDNERNLLKERNGTIFIKCKAALLNNGISEEMINEIISSDRFIPQNQQLELKGKKNGIKFPLLSLMITPYISKIIVFIKRYFFVWFLPGKGEATHHLQNPVCHIEILLVDASIIKKRFRCKHLNPLSCVVEFL